LISLIFLDFHFGINEYKASVVNFYRAMLHRARLCHSMSSVCPSV